MRILLVEDDIHLAEALAEALALQWYAVDSVSDGETAWVQLHTLDYDLIVLDMMLPKLGGIRLCKLLRSHGYQVPVLMITARDTSTDKVIGLDAGADDYMVKPLDIPELLARIRALLRRGQTISPPILEWGQLCLDPATYEVCYGNQTLRLRPKEYTLLELLIRNGQQIMSRRAIIEHVWSLENPPKEETVKVHINSLRYKLRSLGAPDDLIETVHGLGYRLKCLSE